MEGANLNKSTGMTRNGSSEGYVPSTTVMATIFTIAGIILLVGIVGNILVIVTIACVKTMRTTVNKCLFSLALTDLVTLILLPILPTINEMSDNTVPIDANFCKFCSLYDIAACIMSICTFFYVTMDRYFALCHPLKPRRFWSVKKLYVTLLTFWIISCAMSVPFSISTRYIIEPGDNVTHYYCELEEDSWMIGYYTFVIIFVFFVPLPFLIILYGKMIHHLRKPIGASDSKVKSDEVRGRRGRGQVVIMLLVVIVIFVLSQLPFNIIILFYFYLPSVLQISPYDKFTFVLIWVSRLLIYVNSASNPVIYFSLSTNFRRAFHELFFCCANQKTTSKQGLSITKQIHR